MHISKKKKISPASLIARINTLRTRHRELDAIIETEQTRPRPDMQALYRLKRERLGLRDAIHVTTMLLNRAGAQQRSSV